MADRESSSYLTIRTPEDIEFNVPLAGVATRFIAWAVDTAAVVTGYYLAMTLLSFLMIVTPDTANAFMVVFFFLLLFGYNIVFEWGFRGRTPGKMVAGIRVMDVRGLHLQFSQIVLRNLVRVVDLLPFCYLLGGIVMLLSPKSQRLGDIAANTVVVRSRQSLPPEVSRILPGKYNSFREYPHIEARIRQRTTPEEAALLAQALFRRDTLEAESRVALYGRLARHFQEKADFPETAMVGLNNEQYLRNIVEALFPKARGGAGKEVQQEPVS